MGKSKKETAPVEQPAETTQQPETDQAPQSAPSTAPAATETKGDADDKIKAEPKAKAGQKPSLGRVVLYGDVPHAAIITRVHQDGTVSLAVMHDCLKTVQHVDHVAEWSCAKPKHWHWPPRV